MKVNDTAVQSSQGLLHQRTT